MKRLRDVTKLVRSKNAGPFLLTLDIIFDSREIYDEVVRSKVFSPAMIATAYKVAIEDVELFFCPEILAIKATVPRMIGAGDPLDTDVYGAQQIGPLLDIAVPVDE